MKERERETEIESYNKAGLECSKRKQIHTSPYELALS